MGREIRRVPPNWKHPKNEVGEYIPLLDKTYDEAAQEWLEGFRTWERGEHIGQSSGIDCRYFWDYEGPPPDEKCYRPPFVEEATWWQVYETVTEGTPVTPPMPTKETLIHYLVENGMIGGPTSMSKEGATKFVEAGWVPSMIATPTGLYTSVSAFEPGGPLNSNKE